MGKAARITTAEKAQGVERAQPTHSLDPPREADAEREENEASKGPKARNEEGQQYLHPIRKGVSRGWD